MNIEELPIDIAIIGGGLSGLAAALEIVDTNKEVNVAVFEARERVGGRTCSMPIGPKNVRFDIGGQWVGTNQHYIMDLAKRFEVETVPQRYEGRVIWDVLGCITNGPTPSFEFNFLRSLPGMLQLHFLTQKIEALIQTIDPENPLNSPNAYEYDLMSCEDWIGTITSKPFTKMLFRIVVQGVHGVEAHELSLLQFLVYAKQAGTVTSLTSIKDGHQEFKFRLGAQTISDKIAEHLGSRVHFNSPVRLITQLEEHVLISTDDKVFKASCVIIAMPPVIANNIRFEPPLPPPKRQLMQRNFMGSIIKCLVLYEKAFWIEKGFSGEVVHDQKDGPVFNVYDETRTSPEGEEQPALVAFINANCAKEWHLRTEEERKTMVLQQLSTWFGSEAENPVLYHEKNWYADPWSVGCPVATYSPGSLTAPGFFESLRSPIDRLFWAGTETAIINQGFMDGAVQAGKRAAKEALSRLEKKE